MDGGRWNSIVQNDLRLAEQALAGDGVIALDDYCRVEWPDVTAGSALWREKVEFDIIPFAAGSNKLFLCRKEVRGSLPCGAKNTLPFPLFQQELPIRRRGDGSLSSGTGGADETHVKSAFSLILKLFRPEIFVTLKARNRRHPS